MLVFDMPEGAFVPHVDAPTQEERFRWGNILSEIIDGMINTGIGKLDTLQEINEFYNRYCVFSFINMARIKNTATKAMMKLKPVEIP